MHYKVARWDPIPILIPWTWYILLGPLPNVVVLDANMLVLTVSFFKYTKPPGFLLLSVITALQLFNRFYFYDALLHWLLVCNSWEESI